MNVSCTRSSTSASGAPAPARKRANGRAWRRTSSAAAIGYNFEQTFEIMRPYDERLDHLLARAARVFADKGYHPTTMRDLSAASGMSLAGMYYYVRGQEDLLALIQDRCFTQVLEGARHAVAAARDPQERLQAFIRHHVSFFAHHMAEMKVLSHETSPRSVS